MNTIYEVEYHVSNRIHQHNELKQNPNYDTRNQYEVYQDYKNQGQDAYLGTYPRYALDQYFENENLYSNKVFPLSGISNSITIACNETGDFLIFKSDRYGFNNDDAVYDMGNNSRILLVGDSFAYGACVSQEDSIAGYLRKKGHSAISSGMSGNDPLIELATLKEYGPGIKPKKIVRVYYEGNDLSELKESTKSALLNKYLNSNFSQDLIKRQLEVDEYWKSYLDKHLSDSIKKSENNIEIQWTSKKKFIKEALYNISSLYWLRSKIGFVQSNFNLKKEIPIDDKKILAQILTDANTFSQRINADFYFVFIPVHTSWEFGRSSQQKFLMRFVKNDLGAPFLNLYDVLKKYDNPTEYFSHRRLGKLGHLNKEGYAILADELSKLFNRTTSILH